MEAHAGPAGRLAMVRLEALAASQSWGAEDETALHARGRASFATVMGLKAAMELLAKQAPLLVDGIALTSVMDPGGPYAPVWPGHGLLRLTHTQPGFRLLENQASDGLRASFTSDPARVRSFLKVLAELSGRSDLAPLIETGRNFRVDREVAVRRSVRRASSDPLTLGGRDRRIDLWIEWTCDAAQRAIVAIELKLNASVSPGQLKAYGDEARRQARGISPGLFLLTVTPDPAEAKHSTWRPVRWHALLRRWERLLAQAGDDDEQFADLRARLWRWALSKRG